MSASRLPNIIGSIVLILALLPRAFAQVPAEAPQVPAVEVPGPRVEAPVRVFNRTVAVFRAPFLGVTPDDRAERTRRTIVDILGKGGPGKVTMQAEPQGMLLLIDGELALILTANDTDRLRNESLETATQAAAAALGLVIAETREARDRSLILRSAGKAALATLLFVVATWLAWRACGWLERFLKVMLERKTAAESLAAAQLLQSGRLATLARKVVRSTAWLLSAVFAYQWLGYVFSQFPYTRPWGEGLNDFLVSVARKIGGGMVSATPDLFVAVSMFLIARAVISVLDPLLERVEAGHGRLGWLDAERARPTRKLMRVTIWLFTIVMAYPYLPGADTEAFKGMSVLIGLVVTIGGSGLFGQAFSGVILMYSRTLRVGEYVRVNEYEGTVTELGTFTTRIRTGQGEELTLPNALVMATVTKNYSRAVHGPGYIVDTTVTIGYDTPWRQVEAMLVEAARRTPGVLAQPAPRVFQTALSDFYPEYRLVCQAIPESPRPRAEVLAALHANIQDVFNEHSVQIMSPHYVGDPVTSKVVAKQNWFTPPAVNPQAPGTRADTPSR